MFQVIGGRSVQAARLVAPRSAVLVEAVRGRKSRTDPVAKSKEGRIKEPPPVDPVEMVVLKERYSEYQMIMRALRVQVEKQEAERKQEDAAAKREREQQEFIREKEREILQLQEDAKTFITMENLDQRIEEALDNPKNYNFAIDKEGRVVKQTILQ
ncbi:28S ribosomal protein S26 [Nibea albiflora]|uniref:28S ribosomal protein S26 n=1 Tax=Nibea albiflora TaxID=240163 RepID=A0ACB7FJ02_NIBAL|nr:28S ribosomal protein S26 [Nibea albiflora]